MDALLEVVDVSKSYGGIQALDRVNLSVQAGEVHAITGENGAGKSTLMRLIAGDARPDSGEIRFAGRSVAMIHQELLPFPDLTVAENIWMGQFPLWLDYRAMHAQSRELLARLSVTIDAGARMGGLSIAEQQSVAIAQALARKADLIIMDEPTSALSALESEALFRIIAELKQSGVAILYISHRMAEIFRLSDTITVLRDGRHVATHAATAIGEAQLIAQMVGRELAAFSRTSGRISGESGEIALDVQGLAKAGRFHDVSFTLRRGEILGVAGLIGAGRTDVAAAIFGLAPATAGTILVDGRKVRIASPADALACGIAMVTEDRKEYGFVANMSVRENVTLSSLRDYCTGPFVSAQREDTVAAEQIRKFDIRAREDQAVETLSGGNQQKTVLARALLTDPAVLILDEPTRGIDVGARAEIYALISRLANQGKAILLVSSDMNEILALSDRIIVMREGAIVARDVTSPEEILRQAMPCNLPCN